MEIFVTRIAIVFFSDNKATCKKSICSVTTSVHSAWYDHWDSPMSHNCLQNIWVAFKKDGEKWANDSEWDFGIKYARKDGDVDALWVEHFTLEDGAIFVFPTENPNFTLERSNSKVIILTTTEIWKSGFLFQLKGNYNDEEKIGIKFRD